ncbi:hypothetical protein LXA43DRAFT_1016405 [Ganoderma leucocontextum]|nr:hypothetical protein LXA43DRAFT_1016405 [Ganoderma leucocontextum]
MSTSDSTTATPVLWQGLNDTSWGQFWRMFWGNSGKDILKPILAGEQHWDRFLPVPQTGPRDAFVMHTPADFLLIREEWLLFSDRVRNARATDLIPGVLLLGQPGIGKSLFLLFFLIQCLSQEETVLLTSRFGDVRLFGKGGVAKLVTGAFDPDLLPSWAGSDTRFWSLVDWHTADLHLETVACSPARVFSVTAISPDTASYGKARKHLRLRSWYMSVWSHEEVLALLQRMSTTRTLLVAPDARERYPNLDAAAVHTLILEVGPCPHEILKFLVKPDAHDRLVESALESYGQLTTITHLLHTTQTFSNDNSRSTVALVTRTDPVSPTVFTSDHLIIGFKSRVVYERTLDSLLALSGPSDVAGTKRLHDCCRRAGPSIVGFLPFIFDHYATLYTMGQFPAVENVLHHPYFIPMTPGTLSGSGDPRSRTQFISQQHKYGRMHQPLALVVNDDQTVSWQTLSQGPSVLLPMPQPAALLPSAPWSARRRVLYGNIDDLAIDDAAYYSPAMAIRTRNPLFNAFFFQVLIERNSVVLWVLQVAARRDPAWTTHSASPHASINPNTTLNLDTVRELRKRACRTWPSMLKPVEVKYVVVVPHQHQAVGFEVEWHFPAEFDRERGEVFVQFLDISAFCGDTGLGGLDWDKCGVEDVIGVPVPGCT